jgi:hypothetical protein
MRFCEHTDNLAVIWRVQENVHVQDRHNGVQSLANSGATRARIGGFKNAVRGVTVRYVADVACNANIARSLRRGV